MTKEVERSLQTLGECLEATRRFNRLFSMAEYVDESMFQDVVQYQGLLIDLSKKLLRECARDNPALVIWLEQQFFEITLNNTLAELQVKWL